MNVVGFVIVCAWHCDTHIVWVSVCWLLHECVIHTVNAVHIHCTYWTQLREYSCFHFHFRYNTLDVSFSMCLSRTFQTARLWEVWSERTFGEKLQSSSFSSIAKLVTHLLLFIFAELCFSYLMAWLVDVWCVSCLQVLPIFLLIHFSIAVAHYLDCVCATHTHFGRVNCGSAIQNRNWTREKQTKSVCVQFKANETWFTKWLFSGIWKNQKK